MIIVSYGIGIVIFVMFAKILNIIYNNPAIIRGSLFSLFSFINQGIGFILLILLANYIQPTEYGMLSMFNTFTQLLTFFIAFSAAGYVSVSYFSKDFVEFRRDFSSIMILGVISILLIVPIIIFFSSNIVDILGIPNLYIWISVIICITQFLHNINLDIIRIQEKVSKYGIYSCGFAILNFMLSIIFVIGYHLSWNGRVYAQLVIAIVFGLIAIFQFYQQNLLTTRINTNQLKSIALWGLPLIPHLTSNWIKQGCDRLIINDAYSMEEVGIFSFALNLVSIITMVGYAFNQVNSIEIYKTLGDRENNNDWKKKKLRQQRRSILLIYVFAFIIITIACLLGVPILLPKYSMSVVYFIPLSLYGFGVCLYLLYCNFLFYYGENKKIMMITFSSSLFHLLLSLLLTRYSLLYTAIIYVVMQLYIVLLVRRYANQILQTELI